jgi:hypothetical protein
MNFSKHVMQQNSARRLLELMRDVLRLYANFEREMGNAELDHGFHMPALSSVLSKASSPDFLQSLIAMAEIAFQRLSILHTLFQKGKSRTKWFLVITKS